MAEAPAAASTSSARFYCHVCNEDITPVLPEYTCPGCQSGFIEQRDETDVADDPDDELPPPAAASADPTLRAVSQILNMVPVTFSQRPLLLTAPRGRPGRPGQPGQPGQPRPDGPIVEHPHFLGDLLDSLFASFPNVRVNVDTVGHSPIHFRLHGNPGDYAWGNAELDRIVTQLLNQLDASGPPPLGAALIQGLPTVAVTQANVDANMQCMVCFEDYVLEEMVRKLPCSHLYHSICIVPWLELHGTCPVCRTSVDPSADAPAPESASPAPRPPEP